MSTQSVSPTEITVSATASSTTNKMIFASWLKSISESFPALNTVCKCDLHHLVNVVETVPTQCWNTCRACIQSAEAIGA